MKTRKQSFFTLLISFVGIFCFTQCKDAKETVVTKLLTAEAKKLNDQCPIQINEFVRIDSAKVEDGMKFVTYATIIYMDANSLSMDDFVRISKPDIVYAIQTKKELDPVRALGVIFIYSYTDINGKLLGEITIAPEDYNQPIKESAARGMSALKEGDLSLLLNSVVSGLKQALPMEVDEITVLEECNLIPPSTLEYVYSLKMKKAEVNPNFDEEMKALLIEELRSDVDIFSMIEAGVTLVYKYKDEAGQEISVLNIVSEDFE